MKFNVAWAHVASQNLILRFALMATSLTCLGLLLTLIKVSLRDPLLIERGCFSRAVEKASTDHSEEEIRAFLTEALAQRFNSEAHPLNGYLSEEELRSKEQEQHEMKEREIRQTIILNRITKIEANHALVDADKLIAIGSIRSAFPFPLEIKLATKMRSQSNPYGLLITFIKPVQATKRTNEK